MMSQLLVGVLLGLFVHPEDDDNMLTQNSGKLLDDYTLQSEKKVRFIVSTVWIPNPKKY
jgi:hypothetical protein